MRNDVNISEEYINSLEELSKKKIPDCVYLRTKQSLLDYIAVTCAGVRFQKTKLEKYFSTFEPEKGECSVIGINRRVALKEAVFLNGLNGHALDFDDGTNSGIIHLGSPIFSLILPLAEKYNISLEKVLWAAVIGYEASYTMAITIQPEHKALGYHATGTCGIIGAAIAASYMLDYTKEERFHSFAAACVASSGMLKVLDDGSELKPYNVAKSALLALTSIQIAKAGFKGHPNPLGGNRGFFKMMAGKEDIILKPVLLNGTYAVQKTYTKPYASCRYTHPAIEATIWIRNHYQVKANDVTNITVRTYSLAVSGHDHVEIPSAYSAKMSIPFCVSVALVYGRAGLQEFNENNINDHQILHLTKQIKVIADEAISKEFPKIQSAIVEVITDKGNCYSKRIDFPKGEPENPLDDQEFKGRFDSLMDYGEIDSQICNSIFNNIMQKNDTVRNLLKLFRKAGDDNE